MKQKLLFAITFCVMACLVAVPSSSASQSAGDSRAGGQNFSGDKDCTGNGTVVVRLGYGEYYGGSMAVKKAGPPTNPSWGVSLPQSDGGSVGYTRSIAYVSPYGAGHWGAGTPGPYGDANAQCSKKAQPGGSPVVDEYLGSKVCSSSSVAIDADGSGEIWVMWRSKPGGAWKRVKMPPRLPGIHTLVPRDKSVYDIHVKKFAGDDFLNRTKVDCTV